MKKPVPQEWWDNRPPPLARFGRGRVASGQSQIERQQNSEQKSKSKRIKISEHLYAELLFIQNNVINQQLKKFSI